jgi:hypothetical protein
MSIEESLGRCAVGTGLAGVACVAAGGTGGLGAAACGLSVMSASIECYSAGREAWEYYEKNYPEKAREILENERQQDENATPDERLDPSADGDWGWNQFFEAGAQHLVVYSEAIRIFSQERGAWPPVAANRLLGFKWIASVQSGTFEENRDALVNICQSWQAWYDEAKPLKFSTPDDATSVAAMLNSARKFFVLQGRFKAMVFQ